MNQPIMQTMPMKHTECIKFKILAILILILNSGCLLSGCANLDFGTGKQHSIATQATPIATEKTRASRYLYFNHLKQIQKTVYITTLNSANSALFDLKPYIIKAMQQRNYTIVTNINQANIVLRANLLRVGNFTDDQADTIRNSEFGNSASKISLTPETKADGPLNYGIVIDLQAYQRNQLITPDLTTDKTNTEITASTSESQALLSYSNAMVWDRLQTRIVSQELNTTASTQTVLNDLGQQVTQALVDIIKD